jgi:2'-5' RNA ligase
MEGKCPFSIRVCGVGVFPNHKRPRVVWAGVDACKGLISIQEAIEERMELLGFSREEREFRPHLTIGRFRSGRSSVGFMRAIDSYRDVELGHFDVDSISLMRSDLRPDGAVYTRIAGIKLEKE